MQSIRTEFIRICIVLGVLIALGAWQLDFVVTAISANLPLNLTIFGTFLFGMSLIGFALYGLRNEFHALYSIMEAHKDVDREERGIVTDPMRRYYRAGDPAIVFKHPKILGQSYDLISEQLSRDHELSINAGTMQTLVDNIDERVHETSGLVTYVSGILVFLGLIGTFIGLMITLGSVGAILGELDLTSPDLIGTVSNLMANLQTPLGGMATGFSSSLFGLITSLTVSVSSRLLSRANGSLKSEFSNWLSTIVELSDGAGTRGADTPGERAAMMEEKRLALMMRTARHLVQTNRRQSKEIEESRETLANLSKATVETRDTTVKLIQSMTVLARQHQLVCKALESTEMMMKRVADTSELTDEIKLLTHAFTTELAERDGKLEVNLAHMRDKMAALTISNQTTDKEDKEADDLVSALNDDVQELNIQNLQAVIEKLAPGIPVADSEREEISQKADTPQQHARN